MTMGKSIITMSSVVARPPLIGGFHASPWKTYTMAGITTLLQFQVEPYVVTRWQKTEDLNNVLKTYIGELSLVKCLTMSDGGFLTLFHGCRNCFVTVRMFKEGMISVNIEYFKRDGDIELFTSKQFGELTRDMAAVFGCSKYGTFPPLRRGGLLRYTLTTDDRLIEHNIDKVVFSEKSPFQQVTIAHSASYNCMLFLDGLINYSSTDGIYTETLIQRGKEDYRGKEILILGGGDGALLKQLLEENPKYVVMTDIDEVVIRACRTHMREVHGGVLDSMKGPNYEIVIADCTKYLQQLIEERKTFDYVVGDLTDIPLSGDQSKALSFIKDVLNLSLDVMKPSAKYLCHCDGIAVPDNLKTFEDTLHSLKEPVDFSSSVAYVPSFLEIWKFYQIWKKNPQ